jgi:signal transduction histidine kinase
MGLAKYIGVLFLLAIPYGIAHASTSNSLYSAVMLSLLASFGGALLLLLIWASSRQRRHQKELRHRDALFATFFDASPAGLAILDRDLNYLRVNSMRAQLEGLDVSSLEGRAASDLPFTYTKKILPAMHDALSQQRAITNLDLDACGPAATRHWLVSWFPLYQEPGRAPSGLGEVVLDVTDRRQAELALAESRELLRQLAAHREGQREEEYRQLAREFHDELGQTLTSARLHVQRLARTLTDPHADAELKALDQLIGEAYRGMKGLVAELRPPALNMGLAPAVDWLAQRLLTPAEISYTAAMVTDGMTLSDEQNTTLFRIIQEAMTNAVRYAKPSQIHVSLRPEPGAVVLSIADDGCGFDLVNVDRSKRFGLSGMAERVTALGGTLDIDSKPGEGTRIVVRFPSLDHQHP